MGLYSIVSPELLEAGQPEDIGVVLSNLQAIRTIINGGIDATNIANGSITKPLMAAAATGCTKIDEKIPAGGSSVVFSGIPGTYHHLMILWQAYTTSASEQNIFMQFNDDAAAGHYKYVIFELLNGAANNASVTSTTSIPVGAMGTSGTSFTGGVIWIFGYTLSGAASVHVASDYSCFSVNTRRGMTGGNWNSFAGPVTKITLLPGGGTMNGNFQLYGYS